MSSRTGHHAFDVMIVFVDHTECRWLKLLKPGFRHCFTAVRANGRWIVCESLKADLEIQLFDLSDEFDLASFYAEQGHTVVIGARLDRKSARGLTCEPFTCVTMTKRLLGLRSFRVWTPWQLYKFLIGTPKASMAWRAIRHTVDGSSFISLDNRNI
jgi:hypothetical protein